MILLSIFNDISYVCASNKLFSSALNFLELQAVQSPTFNNFKVFLSYYPLSSSIGLDCQKGWLCEQNCNTLGTKNK